MEKPESCKICPLYESVEGIVWGEGPTDAKIMFIGEAPGEEEAITKRPFFGPSGKVLYRQCEHAGVNKNAQFVTNVVKCRPTTRDTYGRLVNRQPTDQEIRACAPLLVHEIKTVNPNVIVALGNIPMHTITDAKRGILDVRSVPTLGNKRIDGKAERYKVVGTFHPAFVMRNQDFWPAAVFDLVRAKHESEFPEIRRRKWTSVIHAQLSSVRAKLEGDIRAAGLYFHDLETTGLDPKKDSIRCIGLSANDTEIYVFDWTHDVQDFVRMLHADPALKTVGQNSEGFDIRFQEVKGFKFNGPTYDTLLGFHLLNAGLPKDLGFIGACSTDELYWKDDRMYKAGEDALQTGCGKDIHATARGYYDQHEELKLLGQLGLYYNHIMPLQPVLRKMHYRGVKKDVKRAAVWHHLLNQKADELEAQLKRALGEPNLNIASPDQLKDLLYKRMGLPIQYVRDVRGNFRPSVDANALDELAMISQNPVLKLVRSIRTLRKWDSTFVLCAMDERQFVHAHFSSAKAANGRINSFDPNGQNWPLQVREIIVPDTEEHVLLARDWSQIEWRIAMALAGDKVGLDALAAGRDPHTDAYAQAFGKPFDLVSKADRFEAKTINYGLLYGRGERSLAAGRAGHPETMIPIERVFDYKQKFFAKYSAYDESRRVIEEQVKRQHYVETAWGRRRYWYTTGQMPEAFNFPISGTAAHMMYEILVELEAQLPRGAELRLTVHDEVVIVSPKDQRTLQQVIDCSKSIMERAFPQITERSLYPEVVKHYYPQGWFCPSDCHIGTNWRMTKGEDKHMLEQEVELKKHLNVHVV